MNTGKSFKFGSREIAAIGVIGALAGGLGSRLADLLEGWYIWVYNENRFKYHYGGS